MPLLNRKKNHYCTSRNELENEARKYIVNKIERWMRYFTQISDVEGCRDFFDFLILTKTSQK